MPTILVTGANRGLGLEFVRQYAADGWRVLAVVRDSAKGRAASQAGGDVYVCDVAQPTQVARLAAALAGVDIDIVLSNAGIYGERQDFGNVDPQEFIEVMRVNAVGPLLLAEALADRLVGPRIFAAMSSKMGSIADTTSGGSYAYRASKAALDMVVKTLSVDLAGRGVIAVALSPGWVRTDMGGSAAPLDPPTAVAGMRKVLAGLRPGDTGRFIHWDGSPVPW